MHTFILWDIDGTLLTTHGVAAAAMQRTMGELIGPLGPLDRQSFSGKTDWQIIAEQFPHLSAEEISLMLTRFASVYYHYLNSQREILAGKTLRLPGAREALIALAEEHLQAPLTGNVAPIAQLKLEVAGLADYLDLAAGAYGNDRRERAALVPLALERAAERYGRVFRAEQIVVVGDTPNDILCARANSARVVAVASGRYSRAELAALEPNALFDDLSDTAQVVAAIRGTTA